MMWSISRALEDAVWQAVSDALPASCRKQKTLVPAILTRRDLYTAERVKLDAAPAGKPDLAARALFYTLADAAKIGIPMAELEHANALPARRPLRVLDVGAGCGAMTLGFLDRQPLGVVAEVTALDRDRDALAIMAGAVAALKRPEVTLETRVASVLGMTLPRPPFDLIFAGSVLNELAADGAARLVDSLLAALADDGALIIIEPATRELSRRLHELRDLVLRGGAFVFAPCTRAGAPCPALADERDWCHEDRPFGPTPRLAALTRATGMRTKHLKFSYLVLRRQRRSLASIDGLLRVVSSLKKAKGQSELFACGEEGRQRLRLQKRDRTEATRPFERARRGNLLEVSAAGYVVHDPTRA